MRKEIEMKVRKEISKAVVKRYKKSSKKEKGKILDEFTKITGYNRSYASWLLNNLGTVVKNFVSGSPPFFQILN